MKQTDLIVLALAGVAVYMIVRSQKGGATPGTQPLAGGAAVNWADALVNEIFSSSGTPFSNGWRYFDNGTAISPNGDYYFQGQLVYRAGGR